jgi:hypothetical protein
VSKEWREMTTNKTVKRRREAPENIRPHKMKGLSYYSQELHGADSVVVDTSLPREPNRLVLGIIEGLPAIKLFKETSANDRIVGAVIEACWQLGKL